MPDSQLPPSWGPAYGERDLDALLSGETGNTPVALQALESNLTALRAAPTRRELSGEAAARAAFRGFGAFAPAPLPWTAEATVPWTAETGHRTVTPHTAFRPPADHRLLPPADHRQRPTARHRHRRPAPKRVRKSSVAVTGAAAAAVIVVAVAVTGAVTGSIGQLTSFGRQPTSASASPRGTTPPSGASGVEGKGTPSMPSPDPTSTVAAPTTPRPASGTGSLCREYFGYPRPGRAARITLFDELSKLARGPFKIFGYCLRYLDYPSWGKPGSPPAGTFGGGRGAKGKGHPGIGMPGTGGTGARGAGNQRNLGTGTAGQGQSGDPRAGGATPTAGPRPPSP